MAKSKIVILRIRTAFESTSNTTASSQLVTTSGHGSHLIDGMRRSHRVQNLPEAPIYSELSTKVRTTSGKLVQLTPTPKPPKGVLTNAISPLNDNSLLIGNTDSHKALPYQSSKAKKKATPRKRKLPELNHDKTGLPAAPGTKKQRGACARNVANGVSSAESPNDSMLNHDTVGLPAASATKRQRGACTQSSTDGVSSAGSPDDSMLDHDSVDLPAASATKEQRGACTQSSTDGVSSAESADNSRPDPFGKPPAWADERQALCESFDGYRAYQSGAYYHEGLGYGYLVDQAAAGRIYMDGNVIITRAGGSCEVDTKGKRTQTEDHVRSASSVACFFNNIKKGVPIIIIVGSKNAHCPTRPLHRYSILGWFHCTDVWPEIFDRKVCFMLRFEKIDLWTVSWWDLQGATNPPQAPDFMAKALYKTCDHCSSESKQVLEPGWVCLNESCAQFNTLDGSEIPADAKRNPDFVKERNRFADFDGLPDLIPMLPDPQGIDAAFSTERNSWKGIVCPECQRCNSRTHWDAWRCETDGCNFVLPVKHQVHSIGSLLPHNTSEYSGRALPLDTCRAPVIEHGPEFFGYWRIQRYTLFPENTITHFMANAHINRKPGGAHQILKELQEVDLGLRRFRMSNCNVKGTLTNHFSANFGMPYKFVVPQDSKSFKDAPDVIMNGLNRMTWAGRHTVTDGSFKDFNELLALGYFEKQRIGYHDDGEDDLLGTIATMSIGGDADMKLRMKEKWYSAKHLKFNTYDPTAKVIPGMQGWQDRLELNSMYGQVSEEDFDRAKTTFFKNVEAGKYGKSSTSPVFLTLKLKHGDITVMNGSDLQKYFEHTIIPEGKVRFAMTCRYVKPENISKEDHWKAEFHIDAADMYDGDPNLIQEVKESMAKLAAAMAANGLAAP